MSVRIGIQDSLETSVVKLSDGNPGAVTCLCEIIKHGPRIDPDNPEGFGPILALDSIGIYGPDIWLLWKDVCGENPVKVVGILRAWQLGMVSSEQLKSACSGKPYDPLPVEELIAMVRHRLPNFTRSEQ